MNAPRASASAEIVGNGPAAWVAAIALAQRGWTIKLIAPSKNFAAVPRIDVLGGSAFATLTRLGISRDQMLAIARPCPGTWSNWGADGASSRDYLTTVSGAAWAVERTGFVNLLGKRAIELGVVLASHAETPGAPECDAQSPRAQDRARPWRILASGCLNGRAASRRARGHDDRLVAMVGVGKMTGAGPVDRRLMIEASPDGWAYGVAGPDEHVCMGVITDAQSLAGQRPRSFASDLLDQTERLAQLRDRLANPLTFRTVPVPCRWLPFRADSRSVRIGDAQASFDPLAGRGLWEAINKTDEVAAVLDTDPRQLDHVEQQSRTAYQRYLAERLGFYRAGRERFGTGFWTRRCSSQHPLDLATDLSHVDVTRQSQLS